MQVLCKCLLSTFGIKIFESKGELEIQQMSNAGEEANSTELIWDCASSRGGCQLYLSFQQGYLFSGAILP